MTALAAKADVVIPGTGFASTDGTYTNTERRLQPVFAAIDEEVLLSNWEVAADIAGIFEVECGWESTDDISEEMDDLSAWIASLTEVCGAKSGNEIPLHITRFFPRFHMLDRPATEVRTVYHLADVARETLRNVYTGNC